MMLPTGHPFTAQMAMILGMRKLRVVGPIRLNRAVRTKIHGQLIKAHLFSARHLSDVLQRFFTDRYFVPHLRIVPFLGYIFKLACLHVGCGPLGPLGFFCTGISRGEQSEEIILRDDGAPHHQPREAVYRCRALCGEARCPGGLWRPGRPAGTARGSRSSDDGRME